MIQYRIVEKYEHGEKIYSLYKFCFNDKTGKELTRIETEYWSKNPIDIKLILKLMLLAFDRPIVKEDEEIEFIDKERILS